MRDPICETGVLHYVEKMISAAGGNQPRGGMQYVPRKPKTDTNGTISLD